MKRIRNRPRTRRLGQELLASRAARRWARERLGPEAREELVAVLAEADRRRTAPAPLAPASLALRVAASVLALVALTWWLWPSADPFGRQDLLALGLPADPRAEGAAHLERLRREHLDVLLSDERPGPERLRSPRGPRRAAPARYVFDEAGLAGARHYVLRLEGLEPDRGPVATWRAVQPAGATAGPARWAAPAPERELAPGRYRWSVRLDERRHPEHAPFYAPPPQTFAIVPGPPTAPAGDGLAARLARARAELDAGYAEAARAALEDPHAADAPPAARWAWRLLRAEAAARLGLDDAFDAERRAFERAVEAQTRGARRPRAPAGEPPGAPGRLLGAGAPSLVVHPLAAIGAAPPRDEPPALPAPLRGHGEELDARLAAWWRALHEGEAGAAASRTDALDRALADDPVARAALHAARGRVLRERSRHAEAADAFARALEGLPAGAEQRRLLIRLGDVLLRGGRRAPAEDVARAVAALAEQAKDPAARADALVLAARAELDRGRPGEAAGWLEAAAQALADAPADPAAASRLWLARARAARALGDEAGVLRAVEEGLGLGDAVAPGTRARLHDVRGRVLAGRGDDEAARDAFAQADALAPRAGDLLGLGSMWSERAHEAMARGDWEDAAAALERAAPVLAAHAPAHEHAAALFNLAECRRALGRLEAAAQAYAEARARLEGAPGGERLRAKILSGTAALAYADHRLLEARETAERALATLDVVGGLADRVQPTLLLALVDRDLGALEASLARLDALARALEGSDDPRRAEAALYAADVLVELGRLPEALARLEDGQRAFERAGRVERVLELRIARFEALFLLGRHEEAEHEAGLVAAHAPRTPRGRAQVARAHLALAALAHERRRIDEGLAHVEEAARRFARLGDELGLANAAGRRGELLARAGHHERALAALEEARARHEPLAQPIAAADVRLRRAESLLALGRTDEALAALDEAQARFAAQDHELGRIEVERARGDVHRARGEPGRALEAYATGAGHAAAWMREQVQPLGPRTSRTFRTTQTALLEGAFAAWAELPEPDAAARARLYGLAQLFHGLGVAGLIAERGRARPPVEAGSRAEWERIVATIRALSAEREALRADPPPLPRRPAWSARLAALEADLDAALARRAAWQERLRARAPAWAGVVYPRPATLAQVQAALPAGTVLLEYLAVAGRLHAFVIEAQRARLVALGARAPLAEDVRALVAAVAPAPDDRDGWARARLDPHAAALARRLHARLLAPLLADVPAGAALLVSPDDALALLPFELLLDGERHLVEDHVVAYAHSGTAYAELVRRAPAPAAPRFAALADPRREGHPSVVATTEAVLAGAARAARAPDDARTLEALAARWALEREDRPGRVLDGPGFHVRLGTEATEEALAGEAVRAATTLVLACHGVADVTEPERSCLYLSPTPGGEDGVLRLGELSSLALPRAPLVVLAACETQAGPVLAFEGVAGLTRAALAGGARAVVSTLWRVPDRSSGALLEGVLARRDEGPARALARAKREALARGDPLATWAGTVVWGDAL